MTGSDAPPMATSDDRWWALPGGTSGYFAAPPAGTDATASRGLAGIAMSRSVVESAGAGGVDLGLRRDGVAVVTPDIVDAEEQERLAALGAVAGPGLAAEPVALQEIRIVIESTEPAAVLPFWASVTGYAARERASTDAAAGFDPAAETVLTDPLRRCPPIVVRRSDRPRPLRQRLHLDVSRPGGWSADGGEAAGAGGRYLGGPFGVRFADADGNEVDAVPAGPVGKDAGVGDWWAMFTGSVGYRVAHAGQGVRFAELVGDLSAASGMPLRVDLRPGIVVVDTGKDNWETDDRFPALAAQVQQAAGSLGLVPDPSGLRFLQVGIDAVDMAAVREFWRVALGYRDDPRSGVTDIVDPRGFGPPLFFQNLEPRDAARREQPNRTQLAVFVPESAAGERVRAALEAGGTLAPAVAGAASAEVAAPPDAGASPRVTSWRILDPEGNELVICGCPPAR